MFKLVPMCSDLSLATGIMYAEVGSGSRFTLYYALIYMALPGLLVSARP